MITGFHLEFFQPHSLIDLVTLRRIDTGIIGWTGCTGYVTRGAGQLFVRPAGTGSGSVTLPNNPLLQNFTFYTQALSFDAAAVNGQIAMSNAGEIIIY